MSVRVVTQAVNERNESIFLAQQEARQELFVVDTFRDAIVAEPQVEHPPYPLTDMTLNANSIENGVWVLVRSGQISTLTLSGLGGWHVDAATLTIENRSPRLAIYPGNAPMVFEQDVMTAYQMASFPFDPPRHIWRVLAQGGGGHFVNYRSGGSDYYPLISRNNGTEMFRIGEKVEVLRYFAFVVQPFLNRIAIVVDNLVEGLSILTADDRLLHRASQTLSSGQSATTPDLAATLNDAAGDEVTFNLMSQSDCVVFVKGALVRRRVAGGFTADVADPMPVGPWATAAATPAAAVSNDPQTATLTGKVRKTGPVRMGLTESAASGHQIVRAHPRLRLVQPFQPLTAKTAAPVTLTGLWLVVDAVPKAETRLTAQIAPWDARKSSVGETLARVSAVLEPGLGAYVPGPEGLLAAWVAFDEPWVLDPDRQTLLHALVLGEIEGPAGLVEALKTHPQLSPARFRDVSRAETLTPRGFGAAEKALLFDLGRQADTAPVTFAAGGATQTVQAGAAAESFTVTLPRGPLTIRAESAVEITDLAVRTATGPV